MLHHSITNHPSFKKDLNAELAQTLLLKEGKIGGCLLRASRMGEDYFVLHILTDLEKTEKILLLCSENDQGMISIKYPNRIEPHKLNMSISEFLSDLKANLPKTQLEFDTTKFN